MAHIWHTTYSNTSDLMRLGGVSRLIDHQPATSRHVYCHAACVCGVNGTLTLFTVGIPTVSALVSDASEHRPPER